MSLWTLLQSVLLVANAFAVLNEERFLEPKSLSIIIIIIIKCFFMCIFKFTL